MSVRNRSVREYTCDHPRCNVRRIASDRLLPTGYSGTVQRVFEGKAIQREWFACRYIHIQGAIRAVLKEAAE